jgi:hypothetical protein
MSMYLTGNLSKRRIKTYDNSKLLDTLRKARRAIQGMNKIPGVSYYSRFWVGIVLRGKSYRLGRLYSKNGNRNLLMIQNIVTRRDPDLLAFV